jgi:hypothetical protein
MGLCSAHLMKFISRLPWQGSLCGNMTRKLFVWWLQLGQRVSQSIDEAQPRVFAVVARGLYISWLV